MASNHLPFDIHRFYVRQVEVAIQRGREIGCDGFGVIYHGIIRYRGEDRVAAFKVVSRDEDFRQEVNVHYVVQSRCVVELFGVCEEKKIIVLEYAENNILRYHLDRPNSMTNFPWFMRVKVLLDVAHRSTKVKQEIPKTMNSLSLDKDSSLHSGLEHLQYSKSVNKLSPASLKLHLFCVALSYIKVYHAIIVEEYSIIIAFFNSRLIIK
ncbi:proline-rich receptor-like protein kinase PERK8 [Salvia divinorum]|uniref:Proline-rich receptor-like protein kinase PERK8 n=1 Tax=Salvia divinorum TaxID=28513 RepID=A0ABD1GG91_SALDI